MATHIQMLDYEVASEEGELRQLIQTIRPSWENEDFTLKQIVGGLVNKIWKATHRVHTEDDAIAVKIFGAENNDIMNRKRELRLMQQLHNNHIIPPIYSIFTNGFAYKYSEGDTLTPEQVFHDDNMKISRLVVEKMHQIQALEVPDYSNEQRVEMGKMIINGWHSMKDTIKANQRYSDFFDDEEFCHAVDRAADGSNTLSQEFPLTFCHYDMHALNLIYNENKGELAVLDWEMAGIDTPVHDIAIHFMYDPDGRIDNAGIVIPEQKDFIEQFVRLYLETRPGHKKEEVTQELVDKWMHGVYTAMNKIYGVAIPWLLMQWQSRVGDDKDFFEIAERYEKNRRVCSSMLETGLV